MCIHAHTQNLRITVQKKTRKYGLTQGTWNSIIMRKCPLNVKAPLKSRKFQVRSLIPNFMKDTQCVPCDLTMPLYWKQNVWKQLSSTSPWTTWRRRSIQSRNHPETSEKRQRISILHQMGRIPDLQSYMGSRISFFRQWEHAGAMQTPSSIIDEPTHNSLTYRITIRLEDKQDKQKQMTSKWTI